MAITIRKIENRDETRWRELWDAFARFHEREPDEALTRRTWARIFDPASPIFAIVAEREDGEVIGLANYLVHETTWTPTPVCYLQDLFVDPGARAGGAGKRMIDWLVEEMQRQSWSRLYWNTKENNYRARALYDKFTPHSGLVRYAIENPHA